MRSSYWSNSLFADKLRSLFGVPEQPLMTSMNEWSEYDALVNTHHKRGVACVKFLDTLQSIVYLIPDIYQSMVYWVGNYKNQSHVLKTRTKCGKWGDLVTRVPDALMLSVISFVEEECFWMDVPSNIDAVAASKEILAYKNQSYIRRKLFPVKISSAVREEMGLSFIKFQIDSQYTTARGKERAPYTKIVDAYKFAKYRYLSFDAFEESGLKEIYESPQTVGCFHDSEEYKIARNKSNELEKEFDALVTKHCTNIVKYREYLWT